MKSTTQLVSEPNAPTRASTSEPIQRASVPHVIVCNALGVGHYQPAKSFVELIAPKCPINITFFSVIRSQEASKCTPLQSVFDNVHARRVILEGFDVHPVTMNAMVTRRESLKKALLEEIAKKSQWEKPRLMIHDPFALFARDAAIELKLTAMLFNPSNCFFWFLMKTERLLERLHCGEDRILLDPMNEKSAVRGQLVLNMIKAEAARPSEDHEPVLKSVPDPRQLFSHAKGVVANDVKEIYPWRMSKIEDAFTAVQGGGETFKYFCVSPLCILERKPKAPLGEYKTSSGVTRTLNQWLADKEPRSVIYVALGTLYTMDRHLLQYLYGALLASPFKFIWSYSERHNPPALTADMLTALPVAKGLVVPWVNQKNLLSHPALRLFVSHCGWNSTLENLCFGGLPTLCVPLGSDQVPNTLLLCDIVGSGKLAMSENPEWASFDWTPLKEKYADCDRIDARALWANPENVPMKYKSPESADEFYEILMDAAGRCYNELLIKAKEAQVEVLKAASVTGSMVDSVNSFKDYVYSLNLTVADACSKEAGSQTSECQEKDLSQNPQAVSS